MLREVVERVLVENRHETERSLIHFQKLQEQVKREIDDLSQTHKREDKKDAQKTVKQNLEQKQKHLRDLVVTISQHESHLGWGRVQQEGTTGSDDDHSKSGSKGATEAGTATAQATGDVPSASVMPESMVPPPGEEQTHPMDVDEPNDPPPPASPVF